MLKNKDQQLLEEAYTQIITESSIRSILLEQGYTNNQINFLIEKGFLDTVKGIGKSVGRTAAIGAAAAGMLAHTPQAKAQTSPQSNPAITQTANSQKSILNDITFLNNLKGDINSIQGKVALAKQLLAYYGGEADEAFAKLQKDLDADGSAEKDIIPARLRLNMLSVEDFRQAEDPHYQEKQRRASFHTPR